MSEPFCQNCKYWVSSEKHKIMLCHIEVQFTKIRATKATDYCPFHIFLTPGNEATNK